MGDSEWSASKANAGEAASQDNAKAKAEDTPLSSIRNRIDHVDALLMRLLSERMQLSLMVADIKNAAAIPVRDREREKQVLAGISEVSKDADIVSAITAVYQTILSQSRDLQVAKTSVAAGPIYFKEVMIVGLGLIGGALARRMRAVLPESRIIGCDRHEVLQAAIQEKLIDASASLESVPSSATLILLCAPPATNVELLRRLAPHLGPNQVVVDVSSTKGTICAVADEIDLRGADFIGGHPFFGTEKSGLAGSRDVVVAGKTFCLTPTSKSSELSVLRLSRWLNAMGLAVHVMDARTHDEVAARISHIVQLVATALGASLVEELSDEKLSVLRATAGPSFQSLSRLMASPHEMWTEILLDNSSEVVATVDGLVAQLVSLRAAIENGDKNAIATAFKAARILLD
ncbi:MAG: bifunctional chorismate mutase/prephenate dehydrogenase [Candidatus Obscuribacterales bacterium]